MATSSSAPAIPRPALSSLPTLPWKVSRRSARQLSSQTGWPAEAESQLEIFVGRHSAVDHASAGGLLLYKGDLKLFDALILQVFLKDRIFQQLPALSLAFDAQDYNSNVMVRGVMSV